MVLRQSHERLTMALAASDTGTFRWEPATGRFLEFDENLKHLFGLVPGESVRTTEDFIARVHPDDAACGRGRGMVAAGRATSSWSIG